jgi:YVTN family beta-propeller protein
MQYRLLGPLEVIGEEGQPVALSGDRERVVMAVLVLGANRVVSTARLVDALWGGRPPATAVNALQVHVSRLRKKLAAVSAGQELLRTESSGYRLTVASGESDVGRFEDLVGVRGDDPEEVSSRLGEALGLSRGAALVDVDSDLLRSEAVRLEELRLAALERRIEADLARGRDAELVPELEGLVHDHPFRETLRGQLMRALYRCGRQADALALYRQGRAVLADQLGIDPSPSLQALELAILQQSPELAGHERGTQPAGEQPGPPLPPPTPPARRRLPAPNLRRRAPLLAAAVALVIAAVAVTSIGLSGHGRPVRAGPNSLAAIDTHTNRLAGFVPVGARPGAITFGAGSLWVANRDDQTVSRIDPAGLHVLRTLPVGGVPTGIGASADAIWVAESSPASANSVSVIRIAPDFNTVGAPLTIDEVVPGSPGEVAADGEVVWVAPSSGLLTRLDAVTGKVAEQVDPNSGPSAIEVGDGAVWVTDSEGNNVTRVDPTGLLTSIPVGDGPAGIAVGEGAVWVTDSLDGALVRIDPATRSVTTTITVGQSPAGLAVGAGSVWVANSGDGTVDRIDARTDRVAARILSGAARKPSLSLTDGPG